MPHEDAEEWKRGRIARWERDVGATLRAERIARGWTQADLAEQLTELGFPSMQTTVAKIESGGRPLRIGEFVLIAEALGIPWQSLMSRPDPLIHRDEAIADMEHRLAVMLEVEEAARARLLASVIEDVEYLATLRAERLAAEHRFREIRDAAPPDADR